MRMHCCACVHTHSILPTPQQNHKGPVQDSCGGDARESSWLRAEPSAPGPALAGLGHRNDCQGSARPWLPLAPPAWIPHPLLCWCRTPGATRNPSLASTAGSQCIEIPAAFLKPGTRPAPPGRREETSQHPRETGSAIPMLPAGKLRQQEEQWMGAMGDLG